MGLERCISILPLMVACATATASAADDAVTRIECATAGLSVSAESRSEAEHVCDVAGDADARLRDLGLRIDDDVRIEITEKLDVAPGACVALYSTTEKTLQVLPRDCLDAQPGRAKTFPAMERDVLFDSLIVHELVHAYVDQADHAVALPRIAHEYLAYAIQIDLLPEHERQRILDTAGVGNIVALADVNEALLGFSPLTFAAMAWVHFAGLGGDAAAVERVLDGSLSFHSLRE